MQISRRKRSVVRPSPCPWLVYYHGKGYKDQTFCYNISGPLPVKIYRQKIPVLHDKKVLSCSYGWLVLYDDKRNRFSLCNSSNFDIIRLPSLELSRENEIDSCILSSSPNTPNCKILLFLKNIPSIMRCGLSDEEWSEIRYGNQLKGIELSTRDDIINGPLCFSQPVICGDKIYAKLCEGGCSFLWSIEIVEPVGMALCRLKNFPERDHLCSYRAQEYMVESQGELFSIFFMWGGLGDILKIEMRRLNFDSMDWETLERIKSRSFFICRDYCLSCVASESGCIYFIKSEDPSLYCYNMEDESLSEPLPCPNLPTQWLSPIWILPQAPIRHNKTGSLDLKENAQHDLGKKGSSSSDEETQSYDLPSDLLQHEIIKRLTPVDYLNLRTVGRIYRQVASREKWRTALFSYPLLMNTFRNQSHCSVTISLNQNFLMKIPNSLKDTTICYSNHGWVLMSRKDIVHLYNPFTKDVTSYTCPLEPQESFFFASKPSCSDYILIGISFFYRLMVVVNVRYPGANIWTRHVLVTNCNFNPKGNAPVFFQDAYYYLDRQNGFLGKLKLGKRKCTWEFVAKRPCKRTFQHNFLVECDGELLSVFLGRAERWVGVYKFNQRLGFRRAWERVRSMSNYNLYLSQSPSFSIAASPGGGNKLYFPRFRGCGIVFYSLETGKWQFFGRLNDTKLLLDSCWIKPS
ncbi:hypothetical protein BUALT_Bualt03G0114700 [Buddleja alternifolia]|uniref:KIB1-4 beta-propeller domain-containing protein n=1 Tax=Buddleja alternifolia TaxID=168488 RepID=A0AAV6Y3Q1_9LAMI|nr:hypothetical protein BUALT_Bualt03G0114700 [Buddleja alternifolia]